MAVSLRSTLGSTPIEVPVSDKGESDKVDLERSKGLGSSSPNDTRRPVMG